MIARVRRVLSGGVSMHWARHMARRWAWQARLAGQVGRMASDDRPILVGPWLSEVGFELLYWVPFLHWMLDATGIARERLHVVSRGGCEPWYGLPGSHYHEVFDYWDPDEFRERNLQRTNEVGVQKQLAVSAPEAELLDRIVGRLGMERDRPHLLHPMYMYNLFRAYWGQVSSIGHLLGHLKFKPIAPPPLPEGLELPDEFVAVKFYFSACFPDNPDNRRFVSEVVSRLARRRPVVLLTTGLNVDDHTEPDRPGGAIVDVAHRLSLRENLRTQTAIVARARAFFGTYGGFSYLAPFVGVPSYSFHSEAQKFASSHLDAMHAACRSLLDVPFGAYHTQAWARLIDSLDDGPRRRP
jgi:hypothetical protein